MLFKLFFYSTFKRICIGDIFGVAHLVSTHFSWRLALSNGKYLSLVICLFLAPFVPQSSCFIEKVKHAEMTNQQLVSLPQLYLNLPSPPSLPLISLITESEGSKQIQGEMQRFKSDLFVSFRICIDCLHSYLAWIISCVISFCFLLFFSLMQMCFILLLYFRDCCRLCNRKIH